jgi:predicted nucleic acid-binding protein
LRFYLDASPVIYLVEQVSPYASGISKRLSAGNLEVVASDLTMMECLVKPFKIRDEALIEDYMIHFDEFIDRVLPLSNDIMIEAAKIQAKYNFKTPDAIHLATSLSANCDVFLTNDQRLSGFKDIPVEIVNAI